MDTKKILLISGVILLAGTITWIGCHHRPPHCDSNFHDKVLSRIDKKVAKLNLSSEQQRMYNRIRADIKADLVKFGEKKKRVHNKITKELKSEYPDIRKIASIVRDNKPDHREKLMAYMDRFVNFYYILDDDQKKKVIEKMRDMSEHFECD